MILCSFFVFFINSSAVSDKKIMYKERPEDTSAKEPRNLLIDSYVKEITGDKDYRLPRNFNIALMIRKKTLLHRVLNFMVGLHS
mgnify:CR=1 FL=1